MTTYRALSAAEQIAQQQAIKEVKKLYLELAKSYMSHEELRVRLAYILTIAQEEY